jgi:carboxypeptidase T
LKKAVVALLLTSVLCMSSAVAADSPNAYAKVIVDLQAPGAGELLRSHGALDVRVLKTGVHAELIATPADLAWLDAAGLPYDIKVQDLTEHYIARMDASKSAAGENYGLYHTYSEVVDWLDELHTLYPDVVSAKWSIGQSHEGRDLWCVRISDNPEIDETGEAEVLFDGMHHAREIMASETCMMLAEYLATRYGGDPDITYLLDTREIYIVPVVNPDGSVYNETISPAGGGMWRKNRRDNGDGTFGVDPNRNYPYEWLGDGSSPDTDSDLYRGPSAGSEPEVQALMALIDAHDFVVSQSFHSYSNLTLYPWGYADLQTAHHATLSHMGQVMTRYNGYTPQLAAGLYPANGTTIDWIYGDQSGHPLCYPFLNEIGGSLDGFWPTEARRAQLFEENLWPSLYQIMAADHYLEAHTARIVDGNGDAYLNSGESAGLAFSIENYGVINPATAVSVTLSTDDPYLHLLETQRAVADLAPMEVRDLDSAPFAVSLDPACPPDRLLSVSAQLNWGDTSSSFTLSIRTGAPQILLTDDLESGTAGWTLSGDWATTGTSSHSPGQSLTDSPAGEYSNNSVSSATLTLPSPLASGAGISFWHRYRLEDTWDFGYLQVSTDGLVWSTLASYTGLQTTWIEENHDLSAWSGETLQIRFQVVSDVTITEDGWYIDDIVLTGYDNNNQLPPAPLLVYPAPGETVPMIPGLTVSDVVDPDSADPVTYGYRVYTDAACTQLLTSADNHATHFWTPATGILQPDTQYWWRAYAADSQAWGLLGEVSTFTTMAGNAGVPGRNTGLLLDLMDATGSPRMRFALGLPQAGNIQVKVYNARGQMIKSLASGQHNEGRHILRWDGRDRQGRHAAAGVYFVNARQGAEAVTRRVLLVR